MKVAGARNVSILEKWKFKKHFTRQLSIEKASEIWYSVIATVGGACEQDELSKGTYKIQGII